MRIGRHSVKNAFQEQERFYKDKGIHGFQFRKEHVKLSLEERMASTSIGKNIKYFLVISTVENESVNP